MCNCEHDEEGDEPSYCDECAYNLESYWLVYDEEE